MHLQKQIRVGIIIAELEEVAVVRQWRPPSEVVWGHSDQLEEHCSRLEKRWRS